MENENNDYVEVYSDKAGETRWRFKAAENGETLSDSGEGYDNDAAMFRAIRRVTKRTPTIVETKGAPAPGPGSIRVVMIRG